jgi:hypothetical protein
MFEHDFLAIVDGGCKAVGTPNQKAYGSYHLATRDGRKQTVHPDLGTVTRMKSPGKVTRSLTREARTASGGEGWGD